jgi:hypothetical protein
MNLPRNNIRKLITALKGKGYVIYTKPYELNIVGRRSPNTIPNKFDDTLFVFWKDDDDNWEGKKYNITTDPATYFLLNPLSTLGSAILKEGQWKDAYGIGMHRNSYEAVVQKKPVTVYRDYNRDAILDWNNGREQTGLFGINIHKAGVNTQDIGKYSAGCQVFQDVSDFEEFMNLARKQKQLYGNTFTYTLIDERAYKRRARLFLIGGLGLASTITLSLIAYKIFKKS